MDFNKILSQFPVVFTETPIIKMIELKDMHTFQFPFNNIIGENENDDYYFARTFKDADNFITNEINIYEMPKSVNNFKAQLNNKQIAKSNIFGYYNNYVEESNVNISVIYKLVKNPSNINKLICGNKGRINKYHLFNSTQNKLPYYIVDVFAYNYVNENLLALQHRQIDIGQYNYVKIFRKLNDLFGIQTTYHSDIKQEIKFGFNVVLNNEYITKVPFPNYKKHYDSVVYITNLQP